MKIKPMRDRVVVKRLEEEKMTKGGIVIPDSATEKPQEGKVVAVGAGKVLTDGTRAPLEIKEGDTILFGKYSGTEVQIGGEDLLIMGEDDILGIVQ